MRRRDAVDVAVVGGGYSGISAALWAARYRRRVMVVDGGKQRNRATAMAHGYLGFDGASPAAILERARADLSRYRHAEIIDGTEVHQVGLLADGFLLQLSDDTTCEARRLILATGVRDLLPEIEGVAEYYGKSVFTCPSCDGYEVQGQAVAVMGEGDHIPGLALSLLDWASSVTMIIDPMSSPPQPETPPKVASHGISVITGIPRALIGTNGHLESLRLADGTVVDCEALFCTVGHEQSSDLAKQLGCIFTDEGCVSVDEHCETSVQHVYAAGDMTPGPHLIQVAAAQGATAGVAAAQSLRGETTTSQSPQPAPDPDRVLSS
ncbi:MAG TPA: NAD(P)/FAD-dependent oxidoreductase [Ilumatobacteraceae bacterium]